MLTSSLLTELLCSLSIIGGLLLLGTVLFLVLLAALLLRALY